MVNCSFCSSPPQTDVFIQSYKSHSLQVDLIVCLFFQFVFLQWRPLKRLKFCKHFSVCWFFIHIYSFMDVFVRVDMVGGNNQVAHLLRKFTALVVNKSLSSYVSQF